VVELKQKMLDKLRIENLPPILEPFWYLFWLPLFIAYTSFRFIKWLLGYWECDTCGRQYWIKDSKNSYTVGGADYVETLHKCDACLVAEKLSE
jgi:hypothetical protein